MICENIFRLKDNLTIRILGDKEGIVIPANDLKPDRYENGIPYISQKKNPTYLTYDRENGIEVNEILEKLANSIEEGQEDPETDNVMYELEKIMSGNQTESNKNIVFEEAEPSKENEEDTEDLDDQVVQQTLF